MGRSPTLSETTVPEVFTRPDLGHKVIMNDLTNTSHSAVFLDDMYVTLWRSVPPVLLVFGTFGNVMIVVVMRGMRASQSTASLSLYFTALAVSDQCTLLVATVWFGVHEVFTWPPSFFYRDLLCTVPYFVFYICPLISAWLLVAMTYQRVTSVVAPHRVGVLCTVRRGKIIIASIVIIASVVNSHLPFTYAYHREYKECLPHEAYVESFYIFTWLDLLWASLLPFVLLIVGNSVLIGQVIRSLAVSRQMRGDLTRARSENKVYPMTMTLLLTSAAFLVLTLPICVFNSYRMAVGFDVTEGDLRAVLDLVWTVCMHLWCAACASNFYIYLLSGSKFRHETKQYLYCQSKHVAHSSEQLPR